MNTQEPARALEEWMLICHHRTELQHEIGSQAEVDWSQAAQAYANIEEMPSFIPRQR